MPEETQTEQDQVKKSYTKIVLITALILAFGGGMALRARQNSTESAPLPVTQNTATTPLPSATNIRGEPNIAPTKPVRNSSYGVALTPSEYDAEEQYYLELSKIRNPRVALEALRVDVETDSALLRSCHAITHSVGQDAFVRYQNFTVAMQYLDDVCNTGYMHGVIEAKFKRSENIEADVLTLCDAHSEGRCFHGVGHGLMFYTENDLPKSLDYCEKLLKTSSKQYCAEGVFMENFNTDQKVHPSKFLSDDDFFYPCSVQKPRYQNACYYYAPLHYLQKNPNAYAEALAWCNTGAESAIVPCIRGVAAVAIKEHITEPKLVEAACLTLAPKQVPYCIDGLAGLYLNHYNSLDKAYTMCKTLKAQNQRACTAGVKSRESTFESEVK